MKPSAVSLLKMLTGGDTVEIEQKYMAKFNYRNRAKLLFASNFPIEMYENDDAFGQRMVYLPFDYSYLRFNPADACELPRIERKEIKPLDNENMGAFISAIQGHCFETLYLTMLFTGLRQGEACGLTWDCVNLDKGTILINKQLQNIPGKRGAYRLVSMKSGMSRTITIAASVAALLKKHKEQQNEDRLKAGSLWQNGNYVFCNEVGEHLSPHTVYHNYKKIVASIGLPDARLHDLRHSFAVASIQVGDDPKTVQSNLGHATATFTLDVYGHITQEIKQASADRMETFIKGVSKL